jgi:hypothetical protein
VHELLISNREVAQNLDQLDEAIHRNPPGDSRADEPDDA